MFIREVEKYLSRHLELECQICHTKVLRSQRFVKDHLKKHSLSLEEYESNYINQVMIQEFNLIRLCQQNFNNCIFS
jgi:hypothetical protein